MSSGTPHFGGVAMLLCMEGRFTIMRLILMRSVQSLCPYYSRLGTNVKVINSVLMDNVVVAGE